MFQKEVVEKIKTYHVHKLFSENRAVYEIMWKNVVQPEGPQMTTWRTRIACWIPEATNTHSESVIVIAFPRQQCLQESASMLRYAYAAYLVIFLNYVSRKSRRNKLD
jgi:hypothetical protein